MKRLTKRDSKGRAITERVTYLELVERLAQYEDAEEQGLIVNVKNYVNEISPSELLMRMGDGIVDTKYLEKFGIEIV